jgi:hypothetical protein
MNACVKTGATVHLVPHGVVFQADLFAVAGAIVVRANGPLILEKNTWALGERGFPPPTHQLHDDRGSGFWRDDLGVFVVPADRLTEVIHP